MNYEEWKQKLVILCQKQKNLNEQEDAIREKITKLEAEIELLFRGNMKMVPIDETKRGVLFPVVDTK